jgi:GMP synthase (glutamine-hydrolysing)
VFEAEAKKIEEAADNYPKAGKVEWFLQGTLYPDVIESISFKGSSATIKMHHNVDGLLERMVKGQGLKLKPQRKLFKDEVREFGRKLGIPHDLGMRHPFSTRMLFRYLAMSSRSKLPLSERLIIFQLSK